MKQIEQVSKAKVIAVVSKPKRALKEYHVAFKGSSHEEVVVANSQAVAKELFIRAHGHWDVRRVEVL